MIRVDNKFEEKLHGTLIEYLLDCNMHEIASVLVDASILIDAGLNYFEAVIVDVPPQVYNFLISNEHIKTTIKEAISTVGEGHFADGNGNLAKNYEVKFRMKLIEVKEGWREIIKSTIINYKDANQGLVSEKMALKRGSKPLLYNEMKFASQSEIRIAQQLEFKKVLFFPLPLAVRNDTGDIFIDHREIDFLICHHGVWGILEVSFHPDRFEKDSEKDFWFKKSGILCIQHYTSERCFNNPREVIDEFLEVLEKYKK